MKGKKCRVALGLGLVLAGLLIGGALARNPVVPAWSLNFFWGRGGESDHLVGRVCTIKDESGKVVSQVSRRVTVGDEIFTADGYHYRVVRVQGDEAVARFLGVDEDLLAYREFYQQLAVPATKTPAPARPVGVYHTHSDESYVPSDGSESIPFKGGIYRVGERMVSKLTEKGLRVEYDRTPHDPHDDNAYYRSRRTAVRLMQANPLALFDVHRDGVVDPGYYRRIVSQQNVAQARLVVGRENPRMQANLDFAKRLLSYANSVHNPIVKEIFLAAGNYNQDLMPTALLIEAGTHTNSREEAERGIALLADAVPAVLGITGPAPPGAPKPITDRTARTPGSYRALAWLLALTLLGGGAFLLVSAGSWEKARQRLDRFFGQELGGIRALRRLRVKGGLEVREKATIPGSGNPVENREARKRLEEIRRD